MLASHSKKKLLTDCTLNTWYGTVSDARVWESAPGGMKLGGVENNSPPGAQWIRPAKASDTAKYSAFARFHAIGQHRKMARVKCQRTTWATRSH